MIISFSLKKNLLLNIITTFTKFHNSELYNNYKSYFNYLFN